MALALSVSFTTSLNAQPTPESESPPKVEAPSVKTPSVKTPSVKTPSVKTPDQLKVDSKKPPATLNLAQNKAPKATRTAGAEKALSNDRVAIQRRAPTRYGAIGLINTLSADTGPQGTTRLSLHFGGFTSDQFLTPGVEERFVASHLSVAYTPLEALEIYANTRSSSHSTPLGNPTVIQTQGDLTFGVKSSKFWNSVGVGGATDIHLYSDPEGGWLGSATSAQFHLLLTVDLLRSAKAPIPFRFLLDIDYTIESSEALFESLPEEPSLVQEWGYQAGRYDRLLLHFGAEVPLEKVSLMGEYHIGTPFLVEMPRMGRYSNIFAFESVPHWLSGGVRVFPLEHLAIDFNASLGLSDAPFTGVPATPPWSLWGALSYTLDPRPEIVEREIKVEAPPPPPPPKPEVKPAGVSLSLILVSSVTQKPIEGATVTYLNHKLSPQRSDSSGLVQGYRLPTGPLKLKVDAEGYLTRQVKIKIKEGKESFKGRLPLKPNIQSALASLEVSLSGHPEGRSYELHLYGSDSQMGQVSETRPFKAKLKPGKYVLTLNDAEEIIYQDIFTLGGGGRATRKITPENLNRAQGEENSTEQTQSGARTKDQNRWARYDLKRKKLQLKRKLSFIKNSAKLTRGSIKVVQGLAKLLKGQPRLKKITILVHTHSIGTDRQDKRLGAQRGATIKRILTKAGVGSKRVGIYSYGSKKTIASNLTNSGKRKNQRVFFRVNVVQ
jgi:outer membrane protein OmpA-like peptidoglycan-associated protein